MTTNSAPRQTNDCDLLLTIDESMKVLQTTANWRAEAIKRHSWRRRAATQPLSPRRQMMLLLPLQLQMAITRGQIQRRN